MSETAQHGAAEDAGADVGVEVGAGETATVGGMLRAAREAAGLSIDDVARSLRFSARQVESIEADDHDALPGNTIVRGFTRSYARLLRLDGEELLRMLDGRTPIAPADVRPPENMGIASDAASSRKFTPVVSVTIVVALAALFLGLWHFFGPAAKSPPVEQRAEVRLPPAPTQVEPVAAEPAPAGAGAPAAAGPDDRAASPRLHFTFEDRSWLEVVDATKQTLYSGENPAGSRQELAGKPPFDIVVGNAGKVRLIYGDREIDLAPYTRAEVARFKLE